MAERAMSEKDLTTRIYTPQSGLASFEDAIMSMIRDFAQSRELGWRLFLRDTSAEHRQSLLGYFWLLVPALTSTLTWVFLNTQNVVHIDTGNVSYPLFVLSGTILWGGFNGSVMAMLGIVPSARGVLSKVNFPHEALIISAGLRSATDAILSSLFLIPAMFIFGASWQASVLLYPVALASTLVLGWAAGLLLVPLAALYGDVSRMVQLILRFGFFLTPVIFRLPESGPARAIMLANPATPMITTGRSWLTGSNEALIGPFLAWSVAGIVVFVLATIIFKVTLPHLIERLSS
jgi:lipopolysaccharide transport system permease protein